MSSKKIRANIGIVLSLFAAILTFWSLSLAETRKDKLELARELIDAAGAGNLVAVEKALDKGADVNTLDKQGRTAIFHGINAGSKDIVAVLLEHKADYNKEDVFGSTPLLLAVENEQEKIAKLLLDHGVDVNAKTSDGWNAMRVAFLRRSVKMARLLRDYGAISSLNITAMIGDGHEMKKQLDEVANFQECGFLRRPPIITATEFGNAGAVKALISYGVDPNSFSENGWTPLIAAARHGHLETVSLLIDNGADVNAQNMYGESALIWAVRKGNIAMSKLLIENGARLQATTANGWEPIMWAAWLGHADMLKYLLKTRETIKTSEFNCKRALWIAETSGRNITKIIKEYVDTHKSHLKNNIILKP